MKIAFGAFLLLAAGVATAVIAADIAPASTDVSAETVIDTRTYTEAWSDMTEINTLPPGLMILLR